MPPTITPSTLPSISPSVPPLTTEPSLSPSIYPSATPSRIPTSLSPSQAPIDTIPPSKAPSSNPTLFPSISPLQTTPGPNLRSYNSTIETTETPEYSSSYNTTTTTENSQNATIDTTQFDHIHTTSDLIEESTEHPSAKPTKAPLVNYDIGTVAKDISTTMGNDNTLEVTMLDNGDFDVTQITNAILISVFIACICIAIGLILLVTVKKRRRRRKQLDLMHARQATSQEIGEIAQSLDIKHNQEKAADIKLSQDPILEFLTSINSHIATLCYDKFIANGWNTMESVCIMDNEDLKQMGILPGERKLILYHINKYNSNHDAMDQDQIYSQISHQSSINNLKLMSINSNSSTIPMGMAKQSQPVSPVMPSMNRNKLSIDIVYGHHYEEKENRGNNKYYIETIVTHLHRILLYHFYLPYPISLQLWLL